MMILHSWTPILSSANDVTPITASFLIATLLQGVLIIPETTEFTTENLSLFNTFPTTSVNYLDFFYEPFKCADN